MSRIAWRGMWITIASCVIAITCLGAAQSGEPRLRRFPWRNDRAYSRAHNLVVLSWSRNRLNLGFHEDGALVSRVDSIGLPSDRDIAWDAIMPDTSGWTEAELRRRARIYTSSSGSWQPDPTELPRWPPGVSIERCIVFTDLPPGRYEVVRLCTVGPGDRRSLSDASLNFARTAMRWFERDVESRPRRTFTVREGSVVYLGQVRFDAVFPRDEGDRICWEPGDERQALERIARHGDLTPWRDLIERRLEELAPTEHAPD